VVVPDGPDHIEPRVGERVEIDRRTVKQTALRFSRALVRINRPDQSQQLTSDLEALVVPPATA